MTDSGRLAGGYRSASPAAWTFLRYVERRAQREGSCRPRASQTTIAVEKGNVSAIMPDSRLRWRVKMFRRRLLLVALYSAFGLATPAAQQPARSEPARSWTQWGGPHRDFVLTDAPPLADSFPRAARAPSVVLVAVGAGQIAAADRNDLREDG
jgi:hypothetical protein